MNSQENLSNLRHSTAHLLAAAVKELYPSAKRAIGPSTETGFYYDFDFGDQSVSEEDFPKIEQKMHEILKTWQGFERKEVSLDEVKNIFKDEPYKLEMAEEFAKEGQTLTTYTSGSYVDLCRGGHAENPQKDIGAFKLMSLAGAYWRGNEKNKMLTRIYGTAFPTQKELDEYLTMLEEAKKRDHKKLGRELELFIFVDSAPGMAYWLPKGLVMYNTLYDFARQMYRIYGYQEISTPQLNKKDLYETSGHWFHYRDDMFISPMSYIRGESDTVLEGSEVFGVKPMNCPNAMTVFGYKTRSYHELPLRLAETALLHRFELSGTLNGLFRTRQFRQDDAHIFISVEQIGKEFESLLKMVSDMYEPFDLTYRLRFGTRPEKFMGESSDWDMAEKMLKEALDSSKKEYFIAEGEGAFYGPKVDILMRDSLGREWQTGTIQLDFQQPKNFQLTYMDSDGKEKQPVTIHRAIYGSFERFLGILVEHYAGALPLWMSPVQLTLLPIADRHIEFAEKVATQMRESGIRVEIDSRSERLQAKIRDNTLQKVPYLAIIGDKEIENNALALRTRRGEDLGQMPVADVLNKLHTQSTEKK